MGVAPGRGGVSRGRADAQLEYGDETRGGTDAFEPKQIPDAKYLDTDATAIVGVGATAPEVTPESGGAGLQDSKASTGKSAWKRRLAPHHREAVQGFFGTGKDDR